MASKSHVGWNGISREDNFKMARKQMKSKTDLDRNWKQLLAIQPELIKKKNKRRKVKAATVIDQQQSHRKQSSQKKSDVWFDVDEIYLEKEVAKCSEPGRLKQNPLVKVNSFDGLTKIVAMDCEMVGTGDQGKDSILARVSIVNHFGQPIYDKYVKPIDQVTDYRTAVSGIRPSDLEKGEEFKVVQKEVNDILRNRILVGHALNHDLQALFLRHPRKDTRDSANYGPFRKLFNGRHPSLKRLTKQMMGVQIQDGEHNSVQDAQAAMRLYTMHRKRWEQDFKDRYRRPTKMKTNVGKSEITGKKMDAKIQKQN